MTKWKRGAHGIARSLLPVWSIASCSSPGPATGIGATLVEQFVDQRRARRLHRHRPAQRRGAGRAAAPGAQARAAVRAPPTSPTSATLDARDRRRARSASAPITVLLNNAANDQRHKIEATTSESWDAGIAVNLKHQFFAAKKVSRGHEGRRRRLDRQLRLGELEAQAGRHAGVHHVQGRRCRA